MIIIREEKENEKKWRWGGGKTKEEDKHGQKEIGEEGR